MIEYNVHWQSDIKKGTVIVTARDGQHAYQLASPTLAAISKELGLMYMNVTIEPKGENNGQ